MKALYKGTFNFKPLGGPIKFSNGRIIFYALDGETSNKGAITINTQGRFFMQNLSLPYMNDGTRTDPNDIDLTKVSYGSANEFVHISDDLVMAEFILAHELGHKIGVYGADDIDRGNDDKTARNNKKIYDACFK